MIDYVERLCIRFQFFDGKLFYFYDLVFNFLVNCFLFLIFGEEYKFDDCEIKKFVNVIYVFCNFFGVVNLFDIFLVLKYILFNIIKKVKCVGEICDEIFERKFGEYVLIY